MERQSIFPIPDKRQVRRTCSQQGYCRIPAVASETSTKRTGYKTKGWCDEDFGRQDGSQRARIGKRDRRPRREVGRREANHGDRGRRGE